MSTRCVSLDRRGFSLVELLVVIAVIAIIASIAIPSIASVTGGAKASAIAAQEKNINDTYQALKASWRSNDPMPTNQEEILSMMATNSTYRLSPPRTMAGPRGEVTLAFNEIDDKFAYANPEDLGTGGNTNPDSDPVGNNPDPIADNPNPSWNPTPENSPSPTNINYEYLGSEYMGGSTVYNQPGGAQVAGTTYFQPTGNGADYTPFSLTEEGGNLIARTSTGETFNLGNPGYELAQIQVGNTGATIQFARQRGQNGAPDTAQVNYINGRVAQNHS